MILTNSGVNHPVAHPVVAGLLEVAENPEVFRFLLGPEPSPESFQWGLCVSAGGLDTPKIDKISTDL